MANYDAQINILVAGQRNIENLANRLSEIDNTIEQIERRWRSASGALQRANIRLGVTGTELPRGSGGRFASDPDRRARLAAFADQRTARVEQQLSRLAISRTRAEAIRAGNQIDSNRELIRQTESRIALEQRLNSAVRLFETRQEKFQRGGGGSGAGLAKRFRGEAELLREEARSITAAFEAAGGASSRNLRLINSLATGLGRVVERQNELNRVSALGSKGFEAGRRLQERVSVIAERGVIPARRISNLRRRAESAIEAAISGNQQEYSEAIRQATAAISRVERESKKLADNILKNAPKSPILGGVNFPGSPKAKKEAARIQEKSINANEKASAAAVALEKQRQAALEEILKIEEKIRSSKRISAKEALNYYFQAQLPQLALPFGDTNLPQMRGGARRIGVSREILGGGRTADEAMATLRLAQATQKLSQAVKTVDPQYNRFLPDEKTLNAAGRGIQRLTTNQEEFNQAVARGIRYQEKYTQEQERLRKIYGPSVPVGTVAPNTGMATSRTGRPKSFLESLTGSQRVSSAISEGLVGGAFPLLFGQGLGSSIFGGLGGAVGGFAGGGLGFGLSLVGTALGAAVDEADRLDKELTRINSNINGIGNTSAEVDKLASTLGIAKEEAIKLLDQFKQFGSAETRKNFAFVFGGGREAIAERLESATKEEDVLQAILAARKDITNEEATGLLNILKTQGQAKAQLALQEALLRLKEKEVIEDKKRITLQDRLLAGLASSGGQVIVNPKIFGEQRGKDQQKIFDKERKQRIKNIEEATKESQKFFNEVDKLSQSYSDKEKDRKKKEKDNSSQVMAEQARQAEQLARNQIELDNAVFRNKMQLADQEFATKQRIAELQGKLAEAQSFGAQRDAIAFFNEISGIQRGYESETRQLQQEVLRAAQELKSARSTIAAQQAGVTAISSGGGRVSGIGGVTTSSVGGYPITSRQGMRSHPVTGAMKMHAGTDIGTPAGTALSYSIGGSVTQATWLEGYGKVLEVQLENGVTAFAAHLNDVLVKAGQKFTANQLLARTGATGIGTAPHLHMEGRKGGDSTVPLPFLRLGGRPSGVVARGQSQVIGAEGDTAIAKSNLDSQIAARQRLIPLLQQERSLKMQIAVTEQTQFLKAVQEQTIQIEREIEKRKIRNRLALEGVAPEIIEGEMRVYDILKQRDDKLKQLKTQTENLRLVQDKTTISTVEAALADYDKKTATSNLTEAEKAIVEQLEKKLAALKAIKEIEDGTASAIEGTRGAAEKSVPARGEKINAFIADAEAKLKDLESVAINISQGIGDAVGNSLATGITGLIEGTTTAKDIFANFLKDVGQILIQEATKMIAIYVAIAIARQFAGLLGGGSEAAKNFEMPGEAFIPKGGFKLPGAADGAYFTNGVAAFAKGGMFTNSIVSSPTLFKFADGGSVRTGLMGEAGPEAIMPLQRGADGKLGVSAKLDGAMTRYGHPQRGMAAGAAAVGGGTSEASAITSQEPIDVRYSVERINNVDYVTADQFQAGMRQAAAQGAQRGEQRALRSLQQSTAVRSRVGMR